jgi:hypothetical protein
MGALTFTIKDETFAGKILNEISISLEKERITVKDIIEARVLAEVAAYNKKMPEYFKGFIQPSESESTLNGYKLKEKKKVDPEKQVYIALTAFQKNGFFILIDTIQAESLEQEVILTKQSHVSFVKLTPLVGG